jgi:hypothetical protein
MAAMTITLLIAAVWLIGLMAVLAVCRAAARGDQALRTRFSQSRWPDAHERPLAA